MDYYNDYGAADYGENAAPGDVGGFLVSNDDEGNLIGSSGGYTVYPVATNAGASYGDPFKALETVTTGIQNLAKGYLNFQSQAAQFKTQQSGISLSRDAALAGNEMARLNNASALEMQKIKTGGAVDIAKYNAATQNLLAQRQLSSAAMPSLGSLFYPVTPNAQGGASINPLFIVMLAGGFFLAYKSMVKH